MCIYNNSMFFFVHLSVIEKDLYSTYCVKSLK